MGGIYEIKEKEKTKDQLIKEVIEMRRKIVDFEVIKIKHKRIEKELQKVRGELELKVKERTAELTAVNEKLQRDITERKRAEEKLRDSEQRSRILFEYAPDAYYIVDLKGNFVDGNKAAEKLIGYKKVELIGKNILKLKLLSPTEIPNVAKALAKNIMGLSTGPDEFVLNRKDNSKVIVEVSTYPVKIEGKTLILGIARDITERKRADEALRESEEKFRAISTSAQDAIIIVNDEGKISYWNNAAERIFGYSKEESMGKDLQNTIIPQRFLGKFKEGFTMFKTTGRGPVLGKIIELTSLRKDGTEFPIEMSISSVKIKGKWNAIGIIRDITERKRVEEKLKQSYRKLGKTMDNIISTIAKIVETRDPYTAGHQQRVSLLATAIVKDMGLPPDKIEGVRIASLVHDIGKINIPSDILTKPGKLTKEEFNLIKGHPKMGYNILKLIDFPWPVAEIILQHHENINGTGYPRGLKDEEILLEAKIICVADVVEAMSSHRPYRPALGIDVALEEISKNKGILYDPKVVEACIKIFNEGSFKF